MPQVFNTYEIQILGTAATTGAGNKNILNVFHYRLSAGNTDGPAAILALFLANVWATIAAGLNAAYVGVSSQIRFMDDATVQFSLGATPASGGVTGARLPTNTSVVFPLRAAQRGKIYRGSKHFGPVTEAHVTGDELNSVGLPFFTPIIPKLSLVLVGSMGSYTPTVLSRSQSQTAKNATTIISSDVTGALLNKTIGTMRRRKEKTQR
jgi:hypothetical protein